VIVLEIGEQFLSFVKPVRNPSIHWYFALFALILVQTKIRKTVMHGRYCACRTRVRMSVESYSLIRTEYTLVIVFEHNRGHIFFFYLTHLNIHKVEF